MVDKKQLRKYSFAALVAALGALLFGMLSDPGVAPNPHVVDD